MNSDKIIDFEPIGYLDELDREIDRALEIDGFLFVNPLGRSVWEDIVEFLDTLPGERTRKLRVRLLKLM